MYFGDWFFERKNAGGEELGNWNMDLGKYVGKRFAQQSVVTID